MCFHMLCLGAFMAIPLGMHGAAATKAEHKAEAARRAAGKKPRNTHTFTPYGDYGDHAVIDYGRGEKVAGLKKSESVMAEHRTPRKAQDAWEAADPSLRKSIPRPDFSTGSTAHDWTDDEKSESTKKTSLFSKLSPKSSRTH